MAMATTTTDDDYLTKRSANILLLANFTFGNSDFPRKLAVNRGSFVHFSKMSNNYLYYCSVGVGSWVGGGGPLFTVTKFSCCCSMMGWLAGI